jgi:glycosyltransferase involved in cell wall biosynthesis
MARAVSKAAADFRPDVVLSNSIEVRVADRPCVTIVHDLNFGGTSRTVETVARERFYAWQGRRLSGVIAVGPHTARRLHQLGVPRVTTIANGVDLQRFRPEPRVEDGRFRVVHPSRVLWGKGQHAAIDAVGRMRPDQRAGLELEVVGAVADAHYADQLRVQAWGLPVSFAFDVPDIAPHYQHADVVVFPTLMEEGFGFTAVEAMACGRPVVYFDQPAVREATGGVALAVPPGDVPALRDAVLRLREDPGERARLGGEGRRFVERYRWGAVWARYEEVLGAAAQRRR